VLIDKTDSCPGTLVFWSITSRCLDSSVSCLSDQLRLFYLLTGAKLDVYIASAKFAGLSLLERQRLVYDTLKPEMGAIHAITMKTWTPDEWEKKKGSVPGLA